MIVTIRYAHRQLSWKNKHLPKKRASRGASAGKGIRTLKDRKREQDQEISCQDHHTSGPRETNDTDIALASWGRLDTFNLEDGTFKADDLKRISDFIKRYSNKGPERISPGQHGGGYNVEVAIFQAKE